MLIQSPTPLKQADPALPSIFIAGGISGCANWQKEVCALIDENHYNIINPRRDAGLSKTGDEAAEQISWEYEALRTCDHVVFWFPDTSICPITLFEYGGQLARAAMSDTTIILGFDPKYERRFDLEIQTRLVQEDHSLAEILVAHNFEEFKELIIQEFGEAT